MLLLSSDATLVIWCYSCYLMLLLSSDATLVIWCYSCHLMILLSSDATLVIWCDSCHWVLLFITRCHWRRTTRRAMLYITLHEHAILQSTQYEYAILYTTLYEYAIHTFLKSLSSLDACVQCLMLLLSLGATLVIWCYSCHWVLLFIARCHWRRTTRRAMLYSTLHEHAIL